MKFAFIEDSPFHPEGLASKQVCGAKDYKVHISTWELEQGYLKQYVNWNIPGL